MKFIKDQYYYSEWSNKYTYIFKATKNLGNCDNLSITEKLFYKASGDFNGIAKAKDIRLATPDEILWFELCKREGRYVERSVSEEEIY